MFYLLYYDNCNNEIILNGKKVYIYLPVLFMKFLYIITNILFGCIFLLLIQNI